jgi:hypothetical protein
MPAPRTRTGPRRFDVRGLHHVGHVVHDIDAAIGLHRRLGFAVPPPEYPALAPAGGGPLRALGAGNTRIRFRHGFVELVTVVADGDRTPVPEDATLVPCRPPPRPSPG